MGERLKVGIIGLGLAGRQHASAVLKSGEADLVAVADPDQEAAGYAEKLGTRCWSSYAEMLNQAEIDAVIISPPHDVLTPAALQAASMGKHILLEKPMGVNPDQAHTVVQVCRESDIRLMVNFVHRFRAEYRTTHATLRAGAIGQPVLIVDIMTAPHRELAEWLYEPDRAGGGTMMYSAIHCVDRLAWLAGSPIAQVSAAMGTFNFPVALEDTLVATVTFENGTLGAIVQHKSATTATHGGWHTMVYGQRGSVAVTSGSELEIISEKERVKLQMTEDDRFLGAFREFTAAIREGRDPAPSGEDGAHAIDAAFAMYEAARPGHAVSVSKGD